MNVIEAPKRKVKWDSDASQAMAQMLTDKAKQEMATVQAKLGCQNNVSDICSPPRGAEMARSLGMKAGVSLDLTVPASDGYIWDFSTKSCKDRCRENIHEQKPLFLMVSPERTPYSTIQNLNMRTPEGKAKVELARRKGDAHLKFCVTLAKAQMERGKYFVYEHPKLAAPLQNRDIVEPISMAGMMQIELDRCEVGLTFKHKDGIAPAKKPTTLLTNSVEVDRIMSRRCRGGNRHV